MSPAMTNPSGKAQDIKAWNEGAFPASGGAVLPSFDDMCFLFTSYATTVAEWKDRYRGATYATRLKAAIADMKFAIAEAEKHPEIATPQTASNEAMVALERISQRANEGLGDICSLQEPAWLNCAPSETPSISDPPPSSLERT